MNMQNTNCVTVRYNRFEANTQYNSLEVRNFDFKRGLKSINSKELLFINMASQETEEVYDTILNMYLMSLDGDYSFLDEFLGDELIPDYKTERLLEIIKKVQKIKYSTKDLKYIFKFNDKKNKNLHFFIRKSGNNWSLLLIDLYHMAIYGENIVNGKVKPIPMQKIYKRYKNNICKLDEISQLTL